MNLLGTELKVLHVLYQSLPYIAGQCIRSRDIVMSQNKIGINTVIVTSPFQSPYSIKNNPEIIDGIKYYRTYKGNTNENPGERSRGLLTRIKKFFKIFYFFYCIYKIAKSEKIEIIHAHSTFFCGLSAFLTGFILKIPVLYEVRSLWEERQLTDINSFFIRAQVKCIKILETLSMKCADKIITINDNLKIEIIKRVKNASIIEVVPNAVNFSLIPKSLPSLNKKKGDQISFGYIGNLSPIEGLDYIIEVFYELIKKGCKNNVFIYGKGVMFNELKKEIYKRKMKNIKLMGSVNPEKVMYAYNNIDVIINPRRKSNLTDTVTPLKPLEAMGFKKLLVASDVGGMKELIEHGKTGLLFRADNVKDLEIKIENILIKMSKNEINKIIDEAYIFAKNYKSWKINAYKYRKIYEDCINEKF